MSPLAKRQHHRAIGTRCVAGGCRLIVHADFLTDALKELTGLDRL